LGQFEKLLIGCGDSGTNDGGAGMAQALGIRLLDAAGEDLALGGSELCRLAHINLEAGIDSFVCILETPCSLSDAIQNTPALLTRTAEQVMRLINIGRELKP